MVLFMRYSKRTMFKSLLFKSVGEVVMRVDLDQLNDALIA